MHFLSWASEVCVECLFHHECRKHLRFSQICEILDLQSILHCYDLWDRQIRVIMFFSSKWRSTESSSKLQRITWDPAKNNVSEVTKQWHTWSDYRLMGLQRALKIYLFPKIIKCVVTDMSSLGYLVRKLRYYVIDLWLHRHYSGFNSTCI